MSEPKKKFVLADATLDEVNKQLKINMFVIAVLIMMLVLNTAQFINGHRLLYGTLIVVMVFFLFIMAKSRTLLNSRKQALTE